MAAHCLSSPLWQQAGLMTSRVHWSLSQGYLSVSAGTSSFKHVDVLVPSVCHLIIQEMSFTPAFLCLQEGGNLKIAIKWWYLQCLFLFHSFIVVWPLSNQWPFELMKTRVAMLPTASLAMPMMACELKALIIFELREILKQYLRITKPY